MSDLALVLWVALLGADRIDILGGEGPVVLTPFYVLTPIVVWTEGASGHAAHAPRRIS